jgi:dTDP-glucose 4,6-dehydratase
VVVTGAGGFIGSHLVERLVDLGARTVAYVRYNSSGSAGWLDESHVRRDVQVVAGDVADRDRLREAFERADVVFHLAALIGIPYSYHAPASYVRTNVEGTLNVLQTALSTGVKRVVHTSTSEVYGTAQRVPIDESHPLQGQSPYSATKIGGDMLAESFARSFALPVAVLRPFNTYGPRQSLRAVIPTIIAQALSQPEVRLGNVTPTRDFTFVEDTVDGFVKLAEAEHVDGRPINIGSGQEIAIGDLAARIVHLVGRDVPVRTDADRTRPDASEVERLIADTARARTLLGWRPRVSLDQGLHRTIEWVRSRRPDDHVATYRV